MPAVTENAPPPGLVLAVPGHRLLETVGEARPRAPARQLGHLVRRADVAVDLPEPLGDVHLGRARVADRVEHQIGDVRHGDVDPRRDVHDLAREPVDRRVDQRLDRLGVVVDVEPVPARVPVAVNRQRRAGERLGDEARHDLLGMLPRPVVVERRARSRWVGRR